MLGTEWDLLTREEIQTSLQIIERTGWKMNSIIQELLLLAEVREAEVVIAPLEMAAIVHEARPAWPGCRRVRRADRACRTPRTGPWQSVMGHGLRKYGSTTSAMR